MEKVICVGVSKTGLKSLGHALRLLGLSHFDFDISACEQFRDGDIQSLLRIARDVDSVSDWPWPLMLDALDAEFPDAKYILTTRKDPETWLQSYVTHCENKGGQSEWLGWVTGLVDPHSNGQAYMDFYNDHNRRIEAVISNADAQGRVLRVTWETGDGWDELCEFLNKPAPDVPFPHLNKGRQ